MKVNFPSLASYTIGKRRLWAFRNTNGHNKFNQGEGDMHFSKMEFFDKKLPFTKLYFGWLDLPIISVTSLKLCCICGVLNTISAIF